MAFVGTLNAKVKLTRLGVAARMSNSALSPHDQGASCGQVKSCVNPEERLALVRQHGTFTLAYSAAKTDRTQPYHSIEVRVERPGLSMLARDGYYLNALP